MIVKQQAFHVRVDLEKKLNSSEEFSVQISIAINVGLLARILSQF
jgi:hypothetical protein